MPSETWEDFVKETDLDLSTFNVYKDIAYVKKVGKDWCVFNMDGGKMGCYPSRPAAERRLKQIEIFKHMKQGIDTEFSASECYCQSCGGYYYARGNLRCDQMRCPICGDIDSSVEITGVD